MAESEPRTVNGHYPAHIRDNPVMQSAFSSFINWIERQPEAHEAHCKATGMSTPRPAASPLDAMIDQATGYNQRYAESFFDWAVATQWGVEGREDAD